MIPGITRVVTPSSRQVAEELEPDARLEEELRDAEVGSGELLGLAPPVRRPIGRRRMSLGVHRDTDGEVARVTHQLDEVVGVREIAGREVQILRRVAAQRKDVADPRVVIPRHDLGQLAAGVRRTGEVRHGSE